MNRIFKKLFPVTLLFFVGIYFLAFIFNYFFYAFSFFISNGFFFTEILDWILTGLCFSFLASLCAWPFSLSLVILLRRHQSHLLSRGIFRLIRFSASLPLVLFLYIFVEVVGPEIFIVFRDFWTDTLASGNALTKSLAFILTVFFLSNQCSCIFFRNSDNGCFF